MTLDGPHDMRIWLWIIVVAFVALACRLVGIERATLWVDEVMTAQTIALPFGDLIQERLSQSHSPAFFLLLKALGVSYDSILLLRLPSALFGTLAAIAGIFAGRALTGSWVVGWFAGLILAITPVLVDYGQEARPYSALSLGVVAALWGAALIVRYPRLACVALRRSQRSTARRRQVRALRSAWLLLVGGSVWSVYMLPLGLFLWPALDLVVVYLAMLPQSRWRRLVRPWVAHRAICIAFCVPLALALVPEIQARAGNYWVKVPGWQRIWQALGNSFLFQFDGDPDAFVGGWVNWFLVALLLLVAVAGVLKLRKRVDALAIVIASAFVPIAVIVLISLHTPIWVSRYFQISTPAFSLLLASGLAAAWAHGAGRVIVFLIAGLAILQLADLQGSTRRADWRPLLAEVEHAPEKVVLVVASLHSFQEMDYEWRRQGAKRNLEFAGISRNGEPTRLSWKHVDIHALGKTHSDVTYWLINPSGKMRSSVETNFWPDRTPCWFGDRRVRALIYRPPHGNLGVRERQVGNCKT